MRHTAEVFLWKTRIGIVTQEDDNSAALFEYDKHFITSGIEVSPLHMPLSSRVYQFPGLNHQSFHGLPGLLSDSLPDKFGNAIIDEWLASCGRTSESFTAVERLCYAGTRGMGALEYQPSNGPDATLSENINVSLLAQLASDVLNKRQREHVHMDEDGLQSLLKFGTSAGGARAKAIIAWNPETKEVKSGQVDAGSGFGFWILKFAGVSNNGDKDGNDPDDYTLIEYAYNQMALKAGIQMQPCQLFEDGPLHHFMTRRFDREEHTGKKIHMQTLAALQHWDYRMPAANSYEQAAQTCLQLGLPQSQIDELFRRMVFNVLAMNCDDHVKNISFLMDTAGNWTLSPAYDMTYAYNPHGPWTSGHQMNINGKRTNLTRDDLLIAAQNMNVSATHAQKIIAETQQAVSGWADIAHQTGISAERIARIQATFPALD